MNGLMIKRIVQAGAVCLVGIGLASCGGGGGSSVSTTSGNGATSTPIQNSFGAGFAADFNMAANTVPPKPMASDIIALSLTTPPLALR